MYDFSRPENVTNREGYDNQPSFSLETHYLIFSSMREREQTDIYRYDIDSKKTTKLTHTNESEYSPTFALDGSHFSVVRVEKDSAQRIWRFESDGTLPKLISEVDSVGYHCWLTNNKLALFVLTQPPSLQFLELKENKLHKVADNIGRCIVKKHNDGVYFVSIKDSVKWICTAEIDGGIKQITKTFKGVEDFAILQEHILLTAYENKLYKFDMTKEDETWEELKEFSRHVKIPNISRIAISPDGKRIAVVSTVTTK